MTIRAYLYDANGYDRPVELTADLMQMLRDKQLLWIDLCQYSEDELRKVSTLMRLHRESVAGIMKGFARPRLDSYGRYIQLNVNTIQDQDGRPHAVQVYFAVADRVVMTAHAEPALFLDSFQQRVKSDTDLGEADAPTLLSALLDWHVTAYFRMVEELEMEIDRIDAHAIRPRHRRDLFSEMAHLRQRVAFVRRMLTPHREVYAAMVRPDFQVFTGARTLEPFNTLADRLERAIDAVENARELLVGSFDIFTTQTNLRTSEAMKVLTLVSFIWFPASVIVGITALVLRTPVDPAGTPGFWIMIALIILIGIGTLMFARWRRWV